MNQDAEKKLLEKLSRIEALFAGATTDGERAAAASARERIQNLLKMHEETEKPVEYKFTLADMWSQKLLVALLRRYGIRPYRYPRQRYTTVMARVPVSFVDEILWPQFKQQSAILQEYLNDVTDRVISGSIHSDQSEADVVEQGSLPF